MIAPETLAFHIADARRLRADAAGELFAALARRVRGLFAAVPRLALR